MQSKITNNRAVNIHWPAGLSTSRFIREFWQKKPLLIRQAFPEFSNPLDADELAGLACDPDIPSRLITHTPPATWDCRHGPFDEQTLQSLPSEHWSLLLSDIEKHLPEFRRYIEPFRFIADWRIDDLMISLAPAGGSVGPHIDRYDVFLLQAHGTRRWQTSSTPLLDADILPGTELQILRDFAPDSNAVLKPGDMLYLPPGVAHHGIALDTCMTWSIGFRAPAVQQMMLAACDRAIEKLDGEPLFEDVQQADQVPGEITAATLQQARKTVERAFQQSLDSIDSWFGRLVTENHHGVDDDEAEINAETLLNHIHDGGIVERHSHSKFAFIGNGEVSHLFVDGEQYRCHSTFAELLCHRHQLNGEDLAPYLNTSAIAQLLCALIANGALLIEHNESFDKR